MDPLKKNSKKKLESDQTSLTTSGRAPMDTIPRDAVAGAEAEANSVLAKIQAAKRQAVDPADYSAMKDAEDQAQKLYEERADRSEWLSLAEKIGNAVTRIGAAHSGNQIGADMSKIDYGPGIDWEGRNQRYGRDLDRSLSKSARDRESTDRQQTLKQKLADQSFEDQRQGLEKEYDFKKNKYGQETDTYQQALRDRDTFKRQEQSLQSQEARAESRARAADERDAKRSQSSGDAAEFKAQVADLQSQLKEATSDAESASQAAQILSSQKDLSKKGGEKLMANYPQVMAKAGITPEQMASIQEGATEKGMIWDSVNEKTRQKLIQEQLITPKQEKIRSIRQALDNLLKRGDGQQVAPGQEAPPPSGPTVAQIKKYVEMYPQVTPDQAKEILTKRMSSGT